MTTLDKKYNRRFFLRVSATAGGGLMIGFNWLAGCRPSEEEVKRVMPSEWFDFQPYIKIGDNGLVTIFSPNPEIGQNIKTSMPMIVAEELDVRWEDVIVEQAALNTNWYSRQVAGGSQSIRQEWEKLRMAGATAKQMLKQAAAQQWETDIANCEAKDGMITNTANGESLGYGDLAAVAGTLDVPEDAPLKDKKNFSIIGTSRRNVDIQDIVTGKPLFGLDTQIEGMKYACVLRPPSFGQTLVDFDDSEALKIEGVEKVISFQVPLKEEGRTADKIAVLATSTWAAMKGKAALTANWTTNQQLESTAYHDEELSKLLEKNDKAAAVRNDGDIDKAFAEADEVLERVYETPFLPHSCMEPMNFFADATQEPIRLVGPIQTPAWTRSRVLDLLELTPEETGDEEADKTAKEAAEAKVQIEMTRMGGGFGRRLYGDFAIEAAQISKLAQIPVQVVFSREDDMLAGTYRPAIKYKIRAAVKDGKVTGYHLSEAAINNNMYGVIPNNFPAGAIADYRVDNHKIDSQITTGAWRAPYSNVLAIAEQCFFDELAELMGKDPVDLRIELLEQSKTEVEAAGNYEADRMIGVIQLAAEKANWKSARAAGTPLGFSVYYSHNTYVAEVAELTTENGQAPKVEKITCAVDCGIVVNPIAAENQVQGGVVDGVGHAMYGQFDFENGRTQATNFDKYRLIRADEAPKVDVHFVQSDIDPTGLGEPSLPPAGGAVANALYQVTGKRLYKQPFMQADNLLG
ncbi:MAG: molybdopterin cofactor-binding domain-containing protein [Bacteroidota bacterium]